jgi:hypothetical protein
LCDRKIRIEFDGLSRRGLGIFDFMKVQVGTSQPCLSLRADHCRAVGCLGKFRGRGAKFPRSEHLDPLDEGRWRLPRGILLGFGCEAGGCRRSRRQSA